MIEGVAVEIARVAVAAGAVVVEVGGAGVAVILPMGMVMKGGRAPSPKAEETMTIGGGKSAMPLERTEMIIMMTISMSGIMKRTITRITGAVPPTVEIAGPNLEILTRTKNHDVVGKLQRSIMEDSS